MKKSIIIQLVLSCFVFSPFLSCIDNDYNFDKVNEDIVLSQNGLYVPIGSLDTMFLVDMLIEDIETKYVREYDNFFSETLYDYFVIKGKDGEDKAIGSVSFESTLYHKIKDIDTNTNGKLIVETRALDINGNDVGIRFDNQEIIFEKGKESEDESGGIEHPFNFRIDESQINLMKDAITLEFTIFISMGRFTLDDEDIIILKNMGLKSSGGVAFKFNL